MAYQDFAGKRRPSSSAYIRKSKGKILIDDSSTGSGNFPIEDIFSNLAREFIPNSTVTEEGKIYWYDGLYYLAKESGYQGIFDLSKFTKFKFSDVIPSGASSSNKLLSQDEVNNIVIVPYVIGGISGGTGIDDSRTDRLRTDVFLEQGKKLSFPVLTYNGYKLQYMQYAYTNNHNFLSSEGIWHDASDEITLDYKPSNTCKYIRLVLKLDEYSGNFSSTILEALGENCTIIDKLKDEVAEHSERISSLEENISNVNSLIPSIATPANKLLTQNEVNIVTSFNYVVGGITSANGWNDSRTDRLRIDEYLEKGKTLNIPILVYGGHNLQVLQYAYNRNKSYISCQTTWVDATCQFKLDYSPEGCSFIRVLFKLDGYSGNFNDEIIEDLGGSCTFIDSLKDIVGKNSESIEVFEEYINSQSPKSPIYWDAEIAIPEGVTINTGISLGRSSTDDLQVWIFNTSNDAGTDTANVFKCNFDPENNTLVYDSQILHNLGHCNSVSYNDNTDCLVLGNGSADYTIEGKLYVIENAKTRASFMQNDILVIDLPMSTFGFKTNAVWGEFDDVVYIISNDSHTIHKLKLGRGSNDLGLGTLQVVGDSAFNGTYKILDKNTWGTVERDYPNVIQGADFGCGKLFWGYGHSTGKMTYRCGKMSETGIFALETYNQKEYAAAGEEVLNTAEGMFVYNKSLYQLMSSRKIYRIPII